MYLSALIVLVESVWLSMCVRRIVREDDDGTDEGDGDDTEEGAVIPVFSFHLSTCSDVCVAGPIPIRRDIRLVYPPNVESITLRSPTPFTCTCTNA